MIQRRRIFVTLTVEYDQTGTRLLAQDMNKMVVGACSEADGLADTKRRIDEDPGHTHRTCRPDDAGRKSAIYEPVLRTFSEPGLSPRPRLFQTATVALARFMV